MRTLQTHHRLHVDLTTIFRKLGAQISDAFPATSHFAEHSGALTLDTVTQGNTIELIPDALSPDNDATPPLIVYSANGVFQRKALDIAEQHLAQGYIVILTGARKQVSHDEAAPDETPINPSENPKKHVNQEDIWQKRYYRLRTALRTAVQREWGISVLDPAQIAEALKDSDNLENAISSYQVLLGEIAAHVENRELKKRLKETDAIEGKHRATLVRLEESIRQALATAGLKGRFHTGGVVGLKRGEIPAMLRPPVFTSKPSSIEVTIQNHHGNESERI